MTDRSVKSLVIVCSRHHGNTQKVARALAKVLEAEVQGPQDVEPEALPRYDLVGFGSGIDSDRHYGALLDLADRLPAMDRTKAFIFSTCGIPASIAGEAAVRRYSAKSHAALREKLTARGCALIGEFSCAGFNTNSFLRVLGGLNRGRPSADDLGRAEEFARMLKAQAARVRATGEE